ncbi:MAG: AAA family ATPase [Pseudomonadota bacterium]
MSGRIIIVSGLPGAGKSTISHHLATHFEKSVHVEADALHKMIVRGGLWPGEEPIEEGYGQLRLRCRNACLLADSFCSAGFTVIIDDIVIGNRYYDFIDDLQTRPLYFMLLIPTLETLKIRNAQRPNKNVFHQAATLFDITRDETPKVGLWLDTSEHTVNESVEAILARYEAEALILS